MGRGDFDSEIRTILGEMLKPLILQEIVNAIGEMDTDFDFTALQNLFEGGS